MSDLACRIASLHLHPIKSMAGVARNEALLIETGLEFDRAWMVVDPRGEMITQREMPRLALVQPKFRLDALELRAPGMLALQLHLDAVEAPTRARVWNDEVKAYDMGDLAAQWVSDFLGARLRLVRFDPEHQRIADRRWTGNDTAQTALSDGFPLLVVGLESLAELNRRLAERGEAAVGIERFRPNLVLEGLAAFEEDHVDTLQIDTDAGTVRLRLVKPCVRCSIPDVDPALGERRSSAVSQTLASFRADARMQGGITFGMNAIVLEGIEQVLRVDQPVSASLKF